MADINSWNLDFRLRYTPNSSCSFKIFLWTMSCLCIYLLRMSDAYMRQQTNHHWPAPSHLNQCWNIVNMTIGNKLQWNLTWNLHIFIQENAFENVIRKWQPFFFCINVLTNLGLVIHIWSRKWDIIGSGNGLLLVRHQSLTSTSADILPVQFPGRIFYEILIKIQTSFKKMVSSKCK